ncbi:MAG: sigma-54-dependent transcriptional regulator [Desulfococcaceae bacterium]
MGQILIIDDDPLIREILTENVLGLGHAPHAAGTIAQGMELLSRESIELVFLDIRLPDGDGLEQLGLIRRHPPEPEVIIITGVGDAESAEIAIRTGAWDYLQKPLSRQKIHLQIERVLDFRRKTTDAKRIVALKRDKIVGNGSVLKDCLDQVAQCADTRTNVLISGETGTGKELFARAIHENSARKDNEFVVVDCASLTESLAESLLFGHEKGAFTGADRKWSGLLAEAHGGTLFLDEVGELPLSVQKIFLRVLQERRFRPVGATRERKIDFRLVSATNRDLDEMAASGDFRLDLLFRLRTFEIHLPPLRRRIEDLEPLVLHHIVRLCKRHGLKVKGLLPELMENLEAWSWPGNVRELVNVLEAAVLADPDNPMLFPPHLPPSIRAHFLRNRFCRTEESGPPPSSASAPSGDREVDPLSDFQFPDPLPDFKSWRADFLELGEKAYLKRLMQSVQWDIPAALNLSGLSQSRLYYYLKKYQIPKSAPNS